MEWLFNGYMFFNNQLHTREFDQLPGRNADTPNFIPGRARNGTENNNSGLDRTMLIQILNYPGRDRILDPGNKNIGPGLDKPEFHASTHRGREIIGQNDQHGCSPAFLLYPLVSVP